MTNDHQADTTNTQPSTFRATMHLRFKNLGNTCYINTILQCLRHQRHFVKTLRDVESNTLPHFVNLLYDDSTPQDLQQFILYLMVKQIHNGYQGDAHEFFIKIIDLFYTTHKDIYNPFQGTFTTTLFCSCGFKTTNQEPFTCLSVTPKHNKSIQQLVEGIEEVEDVDMTCVCGRKLQKQTKISMYPKSFVIHVKRFNNRNKKIKTNVTFDCFHNYRLRSLCNHLGSATNGHYTATVDNGRKGFYMCSDDTVVSIPKPTQSQTCYMLFYECT